MDSREALVLALYRAEVQRLADSAPDLLAKEPPPAALRRWFERLAGQIRLKHGLGDALSAAAKDSVTNETYGPVIGAIELILRAGERDGSIRPGLEPDDVLMLMSCVWRTPPGRAGQKQANRLLDLVLDSVRV